MIRLTLCRITTKILFCDLCNTSCSVNSFASGFCFQEIDPDRQDASGRGDEDPTKVNKEEVRKMLLSR